MSDFEPQLDAHLRDVPVPEGLLARLREVAAWSDGELDQALRAVPVSGELVRRLKQVPADEALDEALRDVPLPVGLRRRLRAAVSRRPARQWIAELSRAAALFIIVGGAYVAGLALVLSPLRQPAADAFARQMIDVGPLEMVAQMDSSASSDSVTFVTWGGSSDDSLQDEVERFKETALAATFADHSPQRLEVPWQAAAGATQRGPASALIRALEAGFNPGADVVLLRWGVLGAPSRADDDLPEVESVPVLLKRGISPPVLAGFDRAFLLRHRVQPITPLNADPKLAHIAVPLVTNRSSFDAAERLLKQRRLPTADEVRVEEFLAAMNYGSTAIEPGGVSLFAAGGPAPFGEDGARLLQVVVQAGPARSRTLATTHLTVALDVSASMKWGGRLESARQALSQLVRQMGPRDRLSLLAFNEEVSPLIESAGRDDVALMLSALEPLRAEGGTNLPAGLQQAVLVSQHAVVEPNVARRLVLITDDAGRMPTETAVRVHELLAAAAADGARLSVLDLSGRRQTSAEMRQLALSGGGGVRVAASVDEVQWGLWEALTGDGGTVATDATLKISFQPKNVLAYRLLGHEATSYGGLLPAAMQCELRANQAATALFEIWLAPNAGSDVATAELEWTDAETGRKQQRRQAITRGEFAGSFEQSAVTLQAAALAAETAEVLRESYFVPSRSRNLRGVLQLVPQVQTELRVQPEFQRLVRLMRQADQLRGGR